MSQLITWVGDQAEPCDFCDEPLTRTGPWVAYRNPYAPGGVRFLCQLCYVKRTLENACSDHEGTRQPR